MKIDPDCNHELLTLYHYDELDEHQRVGLEAHLENCTECRSDLELLRPLGPLLWDATVDQPAVQRIETAVMQKITRRGRRFGLSKLALGGSLAAVLLLLVLKSNVPFPQPEVPAAVLTQVEILEKIELLDELDMLEVFELLIDVEELG